MLYVTGSSIPVLWDNLKEWDRVGGGMEIQEGGEICIPTDDSCWCMAA